MIQRGRKVQFEVCLSVRLSVYLNLIHTILDRHKAHILFLHATFISHPPIVEKENVARDSLAVKHNL